MLCLILAHDWRTLPPRPNDICPNDLRWCLRCGKIAA